MDELDYRKMLGALADAVVATDGSHRIVYANAAVERLLGWTVAELVGQPLMTIIPPRLHAAHREGFKRYTATREGRRFSQALRVPALRRDGSEIDIELTLSAPAGRARGLIVASLRDRSVAVELERQQVVARQLRATAGAAARLGSASGVDEVLESAVAVLEDDFDAALASAWMREPDGAALRLRAGAGPSAPSGAGSGRDRLDVATSPSAAAEAARLDAPVVINDAGGDPRFDREWVVREQIEAVAAFPLRVGGTLRGVLVHHARCPLTEEAIDALAAFVAVVAAALSDIEVLAIEQAAHAESDRQRARLQAILDTLPVGVVLAEEGGQVSVVNPAGRAIWGGDLRVSSLVAYAEAFPVTTLDGVPMTAADRPLSRALMRGEHVEAVARTRRPDGGERVLEIAAAPLPGPPGGAVATFRDVTAQHQVEAELGRRAAQLKALLDHLPVGVAYFDDQAICRICNGPARRILGRSRGETVDAPASGLLAQGEGLDEALTRCIRDGVAHARDRVAWPDPSGSPADRFLDWRFEPLPTDPPGALALIVDVTHRTRAESALKEAKESAERASLRKTQFLSAVSHDLRTPVNAMSLQAELLGHLVASAGPTAPADELRDLAADLRRAAAGLVELINDLLDLSKFDSGTVEHRIGDFALDEWLSVTLVPLELTARAKGLGFSWRADRPGRIVRADRVKLGRVLTNLVGNAIKFTEAGSVTVAAGADPAGWLALAVRDTGPGIPDDQLARIFDDFAQLRNPERDRTKGTGLGLAICRRLVESAGGRLGVASRPGSGSTFTALYPPNHLPTGPMATGNSDAPQGRAEILLVEDDDHNRRPLTRLLERAGFAVEPARDGTEALAALRRGRPGLVLLDLMMPGIDGTEVLRRIRADESLDGLPVVVLSGDITGDRVQQVRDLGIAGLLPKPVDFDELRGLLARLLPSS